MRSTTGYSIMELPLGLWLFLLFFTFPLLGYATLGYHAAYFYYAVQDACGKCARVHTFTEASQTANQTLMKDASSFSGITNCTGKLDIIEQPFYAAASGTTAGATARVIDGPAPQVLTGENAYYVRLTAKAALSPLIEFHGGWLGLRIPGLTEPYPMQVQAKVFFENPQGLTN